MVEKFLEIIDMERWFVMVMERRDFCLRLDQLTGGVGEDEALRIFQQVGIIVEIELCSLSSR